MRVSLAKRFAQFSGVGAVATLVHYMVLIALVQLFSTNAVVASSAGALAGACVAYTLNYRYTFRSDKRHVEALSKFMLVAAVGFLVNGVCMVALTEILGFHYLFSQIVTTAIVLVWTFSGNQFWTFRERKRQTEL